MLSRILTVEATVVSSGEAFLGARAAALPRDLAAKASYLSKPMLEQEYQINFPHCIIGEVFFETKSQKR